MFEALIVTALILAFGYLIIVVHTIASRADDINAACQEMERHLRDIAESGRFQAK